MILRQVYKLNRKTSPLVVAQTVAASLQVTLLITRLSSAKQLI